MTAAETYRADRYAVLSADDSYERAHSGVAQRAVDGRTESAMVRALAADPHDLYDQAQRLADRLEELAIRHAKQVVILDLTRSRACQEIAASARDVALRFRAWNWDPTPAKRQSDLMMWSVVVRKAKALGVEVEATPGSSVRSA